MVTETETRLLEVDPTSLKRGVALVGEGYDSVLTASSRDGMSRFILSPNSLASAVVKAAALAGEDVEGLGTARKPVFRDQVEKAMKDLGIDLGERRHVLGVAASLDENGMRYNSYDLAFWRRVSPEDIQSEEEVKATPVEISGREMAKDQAVRLSGLLYWVVEHLENDKALPYACWQAFAREANVLGELMSGMFQKSGVDVGKLNLEEGQDGK